MIGCLSFILIYKFGVRRIQVNAQVNALWGKEEWNIDIYNHELKEMYPTIRIQISINVVLWKWHLVITNIKVVMFISSLIVILFDHNKQLSTVNKDYFRLTSIKWPEWQLLNANKNLTTQASVSCFYAYVYIQFIVLWSGIM